MCSQDGLYDYYVDLDCVARPEEEEPNERRCPSCRQPVPANFRPGQICTLCLTTRPRMAER